MANQEHLSILSKGVYTWNKWRRSNPDIRPDLSEVDLTDSDLSSADLSFANLFSVNLTNANLERADLRCADIRMSALQDTNLRGADLYRVALCGSMCHSAILSDTHCNGADFSGGHFLHSSFRRSSLHSPDFTSAKLDHADFEGAVIGGANFADVDLSKVRNLHRCRFEYASTLDHRTFFKSGDLPLPVLRGCGIPDALIEYLPSLRGDTLKFFSCFLSHSSVDSDFATRLHADLQDAGVRCWFAPEDMKIGDPLRDTFDREIIFHDKLLLVLSASSIASQWVDAEVESALERERKEDRVVLFPIRIDDRIFEEDTGWARYLRNSRHIGDFTRWKDYDSYQRAFTKLCESLSAKYQGGEVCPD